MLLMHVDSEEDIELYSIGAQLVSYYTRWESEIDLYFSSSPSGSKKVKCIGWLKGKSECMSSIQKMYTCDITTKRKSFSQSSASTVAFYFAMLLIAVAIYMFAILADNFVSTKTRFKTLSYISILVQSTASFLWRDRVS